MIKLSMIKLNFLSSKYRTQSRAWILNVLIWATVTANAATIAVTNTGSTGEGSLRQTFWNAQDGDVIDCSAIAGQTVILDNPLVYNLSNVTVEGYGITVMGRGIVQNSGADMTFRNIRFNGINDGNVFLIYGGTVENCIFTNNNCVVILYNSMNPITVRNCIFANNQASTYAGAITTFRKADITGCTFYNNKGERGGAIYASIATYPNANGKITGCLFYGNTATYGGNVVYNAVDIYRIISGGYNVTD